MKDLLAPRHRPLLDGLGARRTLFAFDYDGTLAPIVRDAARARMRAATKRRLVALASRRPVVLVTGRALADLAPLVEGVPTAARIGNHGLEWEGEGLPRCDRAVVELAAPRVAGWLDAMQPLEALGIRVEDKRLSLSLHLRGASPLTRDRVHREAVRLPGARLVPGKEVLNVLPEVGLDKGSALQLIGRAVGCEALLFAGDDVTDEDVFTRSVPWPLVAIHVGSGPSAAEYRLRSQGRIDELLDALLLALDRTEPAAAASE